MLWPGDNCRRIQDDAGGFVPTTMETWRPAGGKPAVLVRWMMTEWCNYSCSYCPQTHGRWAEKGDGLTAHAFDNFPLDQWLEAFERHFASYRLSLVITGGEPMVDRKNMIAFLKHMSAQSFVECIRIDTNLWWDPELFAGWDFSKIILMCTFHPTQVDEEKFIQRITRLIDMGVSIGMVNYVMDDASPQKFKERSMRFAELGVILHPNPLWGKGGTYTESDLDLMRLALPDRDFRLRSSTESTKGKSCHFPIIAYEMNYKGIVAIGCYSKCSGGFFEEKLPKLPVPDRTVAVPCPFNHCSCLDKYSFLVGFERKLSTNPLKEYSKALWAQSKVSSEVESG